MQAIHDGSMTCRACKKPISRRAESQCPRCNYINIFQLEERVPFDWLTVRHSTVSVESMFREQLSLANELVAGDVASATSLLIAKLVELDQEFLFFNSTSPISLLIRRVQLLYLLICQRGGVRVDAISAQGSADGGSKLWQRVGDASILAYLSMRAAAGEETHTVNGNTSFTDLLNGPTRIRNNKKSSADRRKVV